MSSIIFTNYDYFSALIFSIAIGGVIFSTLWYVWYVMPGSYGSFFGLIAGPLGICAANSKRLSATKCNWKAHIVLVCWKLSYISRFICTSVCFYNAWIHFGVLVRCDWNDGNCIWHTIYIFTLSVFWFLQMHSNAFNDGYWNFSLLQ